MKSEIRSQTEENEVNVKHMYLPPEIEYIPFEPKESGVRTKLYPNPRDCTSGCWGQD